MIRNPHLLAAQARVPRAAVAHEIEARDGTRVAMRTVIEWQCHSQFSSEGRAGPFTKLMRLLAGDVARTAEHRRAFLLQPAEPGEQQVRCERFQEHGIAA